jgi:hypothetical protein
MINVAKPAKANQDQRESFSLKSLLDLYQHKATITTLSAIKLKLNLLTSFRRLSHRR